MPEATAATQQTSVKQNWEFKHWFYKGYKRAFRPRRKPRKRRPTERGQVVITGAVLTAALGLNTETSFVYQLFSLFLCLAIASRLGLRLSRPNITVRRLLPRFATAGEDFTYRIRIDNQSDKTEADLTITDVAKNKMPSLDQYRREREPEEASRNAYDKFIGFHRFIYLQRQNTGIVTTPVHVDEVPRNGYLEVALEAKVLRRGRVELEKSLVLHQDPLSLSYGYSHFDNPESLLVLPKRYSLSPNIQATGGRNFQPGGLTSAWSTGESDEFSSLRDYRDGDSMRKIHWPSSAKQIAKKQNLVVKEYQDEFFARRALILDINEGDLDKVEKAVSVAASLALEQQGTDQILDLIYQDDHGPKIITADASSHAGYEQLEALALIQPTETPFEALAKVAEFHLPKVTGCICVFSSWGTQHETFLKKMTARGIQTKILVITEDPGPYIRLRPGQLQEDLLAI